MADSYVQGGSCHAEQLGSCARSAYCLHSIIVVLSTVIVMQAMVQGSMGLPQAFFYRTPNGSFLSPPMVQLLYTVKDGGCKCSGGCSRAP